MKEFETVSEYELLSYALSHLCFLIGNLEDRIKLAPEGSAAFICMQSSLDLYRKQFDELFSRQLFLEKED